MNNMTVIILLNKLMDGVTSCENKYINRQKKKKKKKIVKCKYSIKRWKDILQYVGRNLTEKPKARK